MTDWQPEGCYQMGVGSYAEVTAQSVIDRMQQATATDSPAALAAWLGVKMCCVQDALERNAIPMAWLLTVIMKKTEYTTEWIMTGKGPKLWANYHLG